MAATIVVGYEGAASRAALDAAIQLARDTGDRLLVAFFYEPSRIGSEMRDLTDALRERGEKVTAHAVDHAKVAGVDADVALIEARPVDGMLQLARERGARMIVVGRGGEGPVRGALLGSVAYKLVHYSDTPVLVVRA